MLLILVGNQNDTLSKDLSHMLHKSWVKCRAFGVRVLTAQVFISMKLPMTADY